MSPFREPGVIERPTSETCYLVLVLNTDAKPPCVKMAFTSSDPSPTTMGNEANTVYEQTTAPTFHEAVERMHERIKDERWRSWNRWLLPYLARDPAYG